MAIKSYIMVWDELLHVTNSVKPCLSSSASIWLTRLHLLHENLQRKMYRKKEHSLTTFSIYYLYSVMAGMNCCALILKIHGLRGCHECKIRVLCQYSMLLSQYRIKWSPEEMALTE